VSTYRLANVSVNPEGRFGAPETEPGPSGTGRPFDCARMGISFQRMCWDPLTDSSVEAAAWRRAACQHSQSSVGESKLLGARASMRGFVLSGFPQNVLDEG
jgi:hypothetical protein